jgi:hypothetical protein
VTTPADLSLHPVVTAGEGAAGIPGIRKPIIFAAIPPGYPLPAPALDEHGEQIRAWLAASPVPDPGETMHQRIPADPISLGAADSSPPGPA